MALLIMLEATQQQVTVVPVEVELVRAATQVSLQLEPKHHKAKRQHFQRSVARNLVSTVALQERHGIQVAEVVLAEAVAIHLQLEVLDAQIQFWEQVTYGLVAAADPVGR